MPAYADLSKPQLEAEMKALRAQLDAFVGKGLALNMARGKPSAAQLDLSMPMLTNLQDAADCLAEDGTDCRNYGVLDGIPEAKRLMAAMLDDEPENVVVFGSSSLNIMYDTMMRCWTFGTCGHAPWASLPAVKWLCPSPGYDRHFRITEEFGIENILIPMTPTGPDMDMVREYVEKDASVKGIWCVPKYSNPQGYTYSAETVDAFAALKPAADDFRIFWDNAYFVHDFRYPGDSLVNIFDACKKYGSEDMVYEFMSTSKVTFAGAGVAVFAASRPNIAFLTKQMSVQTLGYDKINQLRHVKFFKNAAGLMAHMKKQADYLRPKFDCALAALKTGLDGAGIGTWTNPNGGYFISYDGLPGTAKRCVELCAEAGVKLTEAGAAFPYGIDPEDKNIRLAPSYPSTEQLYQSMNVFCICQKIAALEALEGK